MKVLIVDDMLERQIELAGLLQRQFEKKNIKNWNILVAMDHQGAKRLLNDNYFDYVFLDHDFGGLYAMDSSEKNTGYEIAKYMIKNDIEYGDVIVHSINPVGAQNIKRIIPYAQLIPYPFLRDTLRSTVAQ